MSFFSDVQAAEAAGEVVQFGYLVEADFLSGVSRQWMGAGTLETLDGKAWDGAGELLSIGDIKAVVSGASVGTSFGWTGITPEILRVARQAETEAKNRLIRVYCQFFTEAGAPLSPPAVIVTLRMDVPKYHLEGASNRSVSISAENLLSGRKRPAYGSLTDADQKARHPSDLGLELMGALIDKTVTWPDF